MSAPGQVQPVFYRPELDSLRFFAFLLVFLCHTIPREPALYPRHGYPSAPAYLANAGAYGVDLFFCLSGYLITELLLREKLRRGKLDVRRFYQRRILRIWPLYFLMIAIAAALPFAIASEKFGTARILSFLLLSGNWSCALRGYPASVAYPLWSVSIEEQFYLLWPLAVSRLSRMELGGTAAVLLATASAARALTLYYGANSRFLEDFLWCSTLTRLDAIACGILVALLLRGGTPQLHPLVRLALGAAAMLGWIEAAQLPIWAAQLSYPLAAIAAMLMLLAVLGSESALVRSPGLVGLGTISYGLYIFHVPAILIVKHALILIEKQVRFAINPRHLWVFLLQVALSLCTTVVLALLSYRYFESPFLRLKQRMAHVPSRPL